MKSVFRFDTFAVRVGLVALLWGFSTTSQSSQLEEIRTLISQGELNGALALTNEQIAINPDSYELLFLKATILDKAGEARSAMEIYQSLIAKDPGRPEPYNNLAIHFAKNQNYSGALKLLESALSTHPSYETTYKNITAIYDQLASQAYRTALNSDTPLPPMNLASIEIVVPETEETEILVAVVDTPAPTVAEEVSNENIITIPETSSETETVVENTTEPADEVVAVEEVEEVSQQPEPSVVEPQPQETVVETVDEQAESVSEPVENDQQQQKDEIVRQLHQWAKAWSDQDVGRYLSHYSGQFSPASNITLEEWKQQRNGRLKWREFIIVKLSEFSVEIDGPRATANFTQYYKSNLFEDTIRKTLRLHLAGGRWLITQEII